MGRRGHSPVWRVEKGETRLPWCDSPVFWAPAGESIGPRNRGSLGEAWSGLGFAASLKPGTIDELNEIHGRGHRHDLVLGPDTHRARWTALFRVGQPDHRNAMCGRGRASEITATSKWSADTAVSGSTIVTRLPSRSSSRPRADANNRGRTAMSTSSGG